MNNVFNPIVVPSNNSSPIPLPTGVGYARRDITSVDNSRPNPIFDPSANQKTGITYNVGGVSYRKGQ
jgi:hypothetical protein